MSKGIEQPPSIKTKRLSGEAARTLGMILKRSFCQLEARGGGGGGGGGGIFLIIRQWQSLCRITLLFSADALKASATAACAGPVKQNGPDCALAGAPAKHCAMNAALPMDMRMCRLLAASPIEWCAGHDCLPALPAFLSSPCDLHPLEATAAADKTAAIWAANLMEPAMVLQPVKTHLEHVHNVGSIELGKLFCP